MSEQSQKQHLAVTVTDGRRQLVINANLSFDVKEENGVPSVHVSDALYALVFSKLKEQLREATLSPGDYKLSMTVVVCDITRAPQEAPKKRKAKARK